MHLRRLTADDIPLGMALKAQNGWNQLESDWRRQLELEPDGGFVAEVDRQAVGTACYCTFGDIAWISLVLVDRNHRGQGIGTALMRHVLQQLDERGIATIRLDATPLGRPVYEKLGFRTDFELARYEGMWPARSPSGIDSRSEPATLADVAAFGALDAAVTKTAREKLLRHLLRAEPERGRKHTTDGRLDGFCLCRPGSIAWQIGPLIGTPEAGQSLLLDAALRLAGERVFLDVPRDHASANDLVRTLGLTVQRPFWRMTRGRPVHEDLKSMWCVFGPEKG